VCLKISVGVTLMEAVELLFPLGTKYQQKRAVQNGIEKCKKICSNSGKNLFMLSTSFNLMGFKKIEMPLQMKSWCILAFVYTNQRNNAIYSS